MDWIKKQISIAHQGIANAAENSSVESETYPINNKGILIMYCHVIKEDAKIQKNLHLDFYSGQVYFTKGNALVKSFSCSDISKITLLNDLLVVEYKKKYQMTMRSKRMLFCSNFEALQMRNHLQFIGESGVMLRELFVLIDRESIDSIQPVDLKYAFKFHDLQVSDEQCQRICEDLADPKEIITTHLLDCEDGSYDYIQFFHTFFTMWLRRDQLYAPKSTRECLLNWLHFSLSKTKASPLVTSPGVSSPSVMSEDCGSEEHGGTDSGVPISGSLGEESNLSDSIKLSPAPSLSSASLASLRLMSGESVLQTYDSIRWTIGGGKHRSAPSFAGKMTVTDYRVMLEMADDSRDLEATGHSRFGVPSFFNRLVIPLHSLHKVSSETSYGHIVLTVKDTRVVVISSSLARVKGKKKSLLEDLVIMLQRLAFTGSMRQLKLFAFRKVSADSEEERRGYGAGWELTSLINDYARMGIPSCSEWTVYDNSLDWKLCDSYPPLLIVPSKLKTSALFSVAEHRSRGRLPIVTYRHASSGAVLVRSAQPLVGLAQKSSLDDAFIMECFRIREKKVRNRGSYLGPKLYILDLRRPIAAAVNMAAGKGTEDTAQYVNTELIFCHIDNIHVMRASLAILAEAVAPSSASDLDDKFLSKLDESNWLRHLSLLLAASLLAAQKMHLEEASVLCHCSDGYDRTAQMCSLTQMMLDPYYRTIAGFANLIEKDWCAFGHKFRDRCGHGLDTTVGAEEKSPIFLQFLDATHQLMHQFPTAFEFSSLLLVFLADHSTSCLFGNFIGNSYHQRIVELNVVENTRSIWSVVLSHQEVFTNRRYRLYELPIWPDVSLKSMVLWSRYFLRWEIRCHPKLLPGCEDEAWRDFWDDLALLP